MSLSKKSLIALDVGGTKIEGIFWMQGKILNHRKISTPRGKTVFEKAVFGLIDELKESRRIDGIAVACAGSLDRKRDVILNHSNLKFLDKYALGPALSKKFHTSVRIDNDARCFLRGEIAFGKARGKKNVIALTLGTGTGSAMLVDGKILEGSHGFAGGVAHTWLAGVAGKNFAVEQLTSSHGFKRFGTADPKKAAKKVYLEVGRYLGMALSNLVKIFDPELIILGGGIAKSGNRLLVPAIKELKKTYSKPAEYFPEIKFSNLNYATELGAITLFNEHK